MPGSKVIFITGATGYLGCHLVYEFLKNGHQVITLTRENSKDISPAQRTLQQVGKAGDPAGFHPDNLTTIPGDITGSPEDWIEKIRENSDRRVDEVWHCATTFKINQKDKEQIRAINIEGTGHILEFVSKINPHDPPRYFHVSTAYCNGRSPEPSSEEIKKDNLDFRNLYEWSKHEGECLVESYQEKYNLDILILRPSVLIGSKKTQVYNEAGYYDFYKSLYMLRRGFEINKGADFDGNIDTRVVAVGKYPLNVVPIDYAVEAMLILANEPTLKTKSLKIFNIINEDPPTIDVVHKNLCTSLDLNGFTMVGKDAFDNDPMSPLERFFKRKIRFHAPYISEKAHYHSDKKFRAVVPQERLANPIIDDAYFKEINRIFSDELARKFKRREK